MIWSTTDRAWPGSQKKEKSGIKPESDKIINE
jgi:hypothetical protein